MAALPRQALLGVVGRPHVERRQRVDRAAVGDRPRAGDLGPGADADAIGLRDPAIARQRVGGRLAVGPHALLQRAPQLGLVRLANQVVALMIEGGVQEEAVVIEGEVLARLTDTALAERHELLALGESAHVTAHSLKAIGIGRKVSVEEEKGRSYLDIRAQTT
jgi:hypothetical protein